MRRKLFSELLLLTAAFLLAACSTESSTELTYTDVPEANNDEETVTPTPVRVFVNNRNLFTMDGSRWARQQNLDDTRGVGSFQMWKDEDIMDQLANGTLSDEDRAMLKLKYERTNFYIYAFRAKTYIKPVYDAPDFRYYNLVDVENPLTHAPGGNFSDTHNKSHCLVDGQDYYKGLLANLEMADYDNGGRFNLKTPLKPDNSGDRTVIYYPERVDRGYNFFAYSIGDISTDDFSTTDNTVDWGQCERLEDQVVYRNFTIDGSQDIMVGYAPPIQYAISSIPNLDYTEMEQIKQFGYCTFAAQRGVDPKVNLHHEMTRIRFRGAAGDESSNHTSIHSIRVKCYNKGDFIVAHRDTNQVGFHPYTQSPDMMGEVYVHDKAELVYDDETNKIIGLTPSKIHDTEGVDEEGNPLVDRNDCWHVDWQDRYNIYGDPQHPNVVTGKVDLSERLCDAVDFGDDLLLPPSESLDIYIKSSYRNVVNHGTGVSDEPKFDVRHFLTHYVIKAADIVESNPSVEKLFLDDKYYKETGEKRYIFKPGYFYTLTHVVYGFSQTTTDANIDAWQEGVTDIIMDERSGE